MALVDFSKTVKTTLAHRAAYICSNPDCRTLTLTLAGADALKVVYKGRAVPICGAQGGARHDAGMTGNQRKAIENAIFLCVKCAEITNRSKGAYYPAAILREWKEQHKRWVRTHLNLRPEAPVPLALVPPARPLADGVTAPAKVPAAAQRRK